MKKFLSIVLALVMALSVATAGFAAAAYTCESCYEVFATEALYTAHTSGGCLVDFGKCQYCSAKVATDNLTTHEANCPDGATTCDYCGEDFATAGEYDAHIDACKEAYMNIPVASILNTVVEAVKNIDWEDVFGQIKDAISGIDFEGIIAEIQPIVEKVVAYVQGLFAA